MESEQETLGLPSNSNENPKAPLAGISKKKRLQMKIEIAIKHSEADPES
jgi:hypothetical protein